MKDRGEPPTVVLVPGFMQRGRSWATVADLLPARYRVRCLDLSGAVLEELIDEIVVAVPPGGAVVGYSMGGRLALHAALGADRRWGALVTVGASAGIDDRRERGERLARDERLADWIERHDIRDVVAHWETLPVFSTQPPELVRAQRRDRLSHDPPRLARLLRSAGQGRLPPMWQRLPQLSCPLLAVAGDRDAAYAGAARRMADLVPRGRAALVPGAGHAAHLEAPDAFTRLLLEFLDEHLVQRALAHGDS